MSRSSPQKSKEAGRASNSLDRQRSCETNRRRPDVCSARKPSLSISPSPPNHTVMSHAWTSICHQRAQSLTRIGRCDLIPFAFSWRVIIKLVDRPWRLREDRTFRRRGQTEKVACIHNTWLQTRSLIKKQQPNYPGLRPVARTA